MLCTSHTQMVGNAEIRDCFEATAVYTPTHLCDVGPRWWRCLWDGGRRGVSSSTDRLVHVSIAGAPRDKGAWRYLMRWSIGTLQQHMQSSQLGDSSTTYQSPAALASFRHRHSYRSVHWRPQVLKRNVNRATPSTVTSRCLSHAIYSPI